MDFPPWSGLLRSKLIFDHAEVAELAFSVSPCTLTQYGPFVQTLEA
jgi:hypothetical protein